MSKARFREHSEWYDVRQRFTLPNGKRVRLASVRQLDQLKEGRGIFRLRRQIELAEEFMRTQMGQKTEGVEDMTKLSHVVRTNAQVRGYERGGGRREALKRAKKRGITL